MVEYKNKEGFVFRVFSSMYVDWGLEIVGPNGETIMYSPSCLSNESYGFKPAPAYDDWEIAEEAFNKGDLKAFVAWDDDDWKSCLAEEADDLIDCYLIGTEGDN